MRSRAQAYLPSSTTALPVHRPSPRRALGADCVVPRVLTTFPGILLTLLGPFSFPRLLFAYISLSRAVNAIVRYHSLPAMFRFPVLRTSYQLFLTCPDRDCTWWCLGYPSALYEYRVEPSSCSSCTRCNPRPSFSRMNLYNTSLIHGQPFQCMQCPQVEEGRSGHMNGAKLIRTKILVYRHKPQ